MSTSLGAFRDELLDALLGFVWRQWAAIGVPAKTSGADRYCVDPEALFALTCSVGRYDPRLFDEALDWLVKYERLISTQRLRTLFQKKLFSGVCVAGAVASFLKQETGMKRWEMIATQGRREQENTGLFFLRDSRALPVIGESDAGFLHAGFVREAVRLRRHATLRTEGNSPILLRLRGLFGVNARCEILLYLMTHQAGYPRAIARQTFYAQKTIHDALDDMRLSRYVQSSRTGRERRYRVESSALSNALLDGNTPAWMNWPVVLGALERAWISIDAIAFKELDPMLQISQGRSISETLIKAVYDQDAVPALPEPRTSSLAAALHPVRELLRVIEA